MIVKSLYEKGLKSRINEGLENEASKAGILRGGNSGCITEDGTILGACPRVTYLRYKGIQADPIPDNRHIMFAAGLGNEDIWLDNLKRSYDGPILCEEDIPTKWETENGTFVTGRPDVVLCSSNDSNEPLPQLGIELKLISSVWTARDILIEDKPKVNHLIQAAHYSWQLDVPFELWYTSRVDWHPPDMMNRLLPRYGTPEWDRLVKYAQPKYSKWVMSRSGNMYKKEIPFEEFKPERQGYNEGDYSAYFLKLLPFIAGFTLAWGPNGRLTYTSVQTGISQETPITREGIKNYYEMISRIDETGILPPSPTNIKADGSKSYDHAKYCPVCGDDSIKTLDDLMKVVS